MTGGSSHGRVLHVLTGCTAAGKTEWALGWAQANGAEIISCDSLLFYRGMDIGTAKPSREELSRVPHHLIDIRAVTEPMNVAVYAALAHEAALAIAGRGRPVLVVGGSGFYLKSFFGPVSDGVDVPEAVRERVAALQRAGGVDALVEELNRLNPEGLPPLDLANPRRVAGALGRCLATGRRLDALVEDFGRAPYPFDGWTIRLARVDREPAELERRIGARVEAMLGAGLVAEVAGLLKAGLAANPSASRAIGYREVVDVIEGRAPIEGLAEAIFRDTRALVKKQRTWFRTQLPPHAVFDGSGPGGPGRLFLG